MAKFDLHGFEQLIEKLDQLGRFDEIAPRMLTESVPILEEEVIKQASSHWVSGDMANSIKKTGLLAGKNGSYYISVRPTGVDHNGIRNMEKAAWLEFGVKGRPAIPILTTAVLNATPRVLAKMQEVFNREVEGR